MQGNFTEGVPKRRSCHGRAGAPRNSAPGGETHPSQAGGQGRQFASFLRTFVIRLVGGRPIGLQTEVEYVVCT